MLFQILVFAFKPLTLGLFLFELSAKVLQVGSKLSIKTLAGSLPALLAETLDVRFEISFQSELFLLFHLQTLVVFDFEFDQTLVQLLDDLLFLVEHVPHIHYSLDRDVEDFNYV